MPAIRFKVLPGNPLPWQQLPHNTPDLLSLPLFHSVWWLPIEPVLLLLLVVAAVDDVYIKTMLPLKHYSHSQVWCMVPVQLNCTRTHTRHHHHHHQLMLEVPNSGLTVVVLHEEIHALDVWGNLLRSGRKNKAYSVFLIPNYFRYGAKNSYFLALFHYWR